MTPDRVAAASAAWAWYPADAEAVETDDALLVRWPDYYGVPPTVLRVAPDAADEAVAEVLDRAGAQAGAWGSDELQVWVRLDAPPGLVPALVDRGGALDETLDVLALDLARGAPALGVPDDVEVVWQHDEATTRDVLRVGVEAFEEGRVPGDDTVRALAAEAAADLAAGRGATALALLDGRPVGSGGMTLVDGVARLYGGGVVPDARGRGVYRAVLAARLAWAAERGASIALVKGRVETSGPILRRAGFQVFGREHLYVVPVAPGTS